MVPLNQDAGRSKEGGCVLLFFLPSSAYLLLEEFLCLNLKIYIGALQMDAL